MSRTVAVATHQKASKTPLLLSERWPLSTGNNHSKETDMKPLTFAFSFIAIAASACAISDDDQVISEDESTGMDEQQLANDAQFNELPDRAPLVHTSVAILNTDGTRAATAWFNSGAGKNYWDIKDEKCDGKSVNLHYTIAGSWFSTQLSTGCGTEKRFLLTQGKAGNALGYYLRLTTSSATSSTVNDIKG